jgi:NAD(P)H-hydrate epimerase
MLVIGGSQGYTGASIFVCRAALKTGVGLLYIATPESLNTIYETSLPEVISIPVKTNEDGSFSITEKARITEKLKEMNSVVIGPGLGKTYDKTDLLVSLLKEADIPIVIDADAIRILKEIPNYENLLNEKMVLTPHYGEFSYLTGISIEELKSDPIKHSKEFVKKTNVVLVLKGNPTIITTPETKVFVSTRGNSGLATGGSGDVLAGMIGSYIAQGKNTVEASVLSVFLHGYTAELYSQEYAEESLLPSKLIDYLPISLKELRK